MENIFNKKQALHICDGRLLDPVVNIFNNLMATVLKNRIGIYCLFALLWLIVFSAVPTFHAPDGHNFTAYYGIILLGILCLPIRWEIKIFGVVCAASCIWLQFMIAFVEPAMKPLFIRLYASANSSFQFVAIFIAIYGIFIIKNPSFDTWLTLLRWMALVEIIRVCVQQFGWDPFYIPISGPMPEIPAGSQGNQGWSGAMLAMCAPAFFDRRYAYGLIPLAGALYILKSTTPVIALVLSIIFYCYFMFNKKYVLAVTAAGLLAVLLYGGYDHASGARFGAWMHAISLCLDREAWLLGFGLGSWPTLFPATYDQTVIWTHAHNEFIQLWFELGALGILCVLLYTRFLIISIINNYANRVLILAGSGIISIILCSMGNFPMHLSGTAVIAVGWLAVYEIEAQGARLKAQGEEE